MPNRANFARAFGLIKGKQFAGYTLTSISLTHHADVPYHKYSYHITVTFNPNSSSSNPQALKHDLAETFSHSHSVKGIRNYYTCTIDPPSHSSTAKNGQITYYLLGHATR